MSFLVLLNTRVILLSHSNRLKIITAHFMVTTERILVERLARLFKDNVFKSYRLQKSVICWKISVQLNVHILSLHRLIFYSIYFLIFLFLNSVVTSTFHYHSCCRYVMEITLLSLLYKHIHTWVFVLSL